LGWVGLGVELGSGSCGWGGCGRWRWREGGADGAAPRVGAEGVDVLVLSDVDGLDQGLAEVAEDGGGFGLDVTLDDGGKEMAESGTEIAGGEILAGEARGDVAADLVGGEGLGFLAGVKGAKVRVAGAAGRAAAATVGEREGTTRRNDRWRNGRAWSLQNRKLGRWGMLAEARDTIEQLIVADW